MDYDIVIIGSGVGGGCAALALANSGARILILERGERLPREPQNWSAESVFVEQRYRTTETWYDGNDKPFNPGQFYFVGGHTKFYGTAMFRFRERDFEAVDHAEGISPEWPIKYRDLEPFYAQAEALFGVRGRAGDDPTEPPRSGPYPHPPIPHEPLIGRIAQKLSAHGLKPFHMPSAVDFGAGGKCVRCGTCDAFPCRIGAKGDGETRLIDPALTHKNVELLSGALVERLIADENGKRIVAAEVKHRGESKRISARVFVLAAGAINSSLLLLKSTHARNPKGLANSSGVVGRHFMSHNCTALMTLMPFETNATRFPKTISVNDYYYGHGSYRRPLGNLQMLGKIQEPMLRNVLPKTPKWARAMMARHSVDWYVMSEDLPHAESRVQFRPDGAVRLHWHRTNMSPHLEFVRVTKQMLKDIGFKIVLSKPFGSDSPSHQCGTIRMGNDPAHAAVDAYGRSFDHPNLFVTDASVFPSSAALNPALTVAAFALRAANQLKRELVS